MITGMDTNIFTCLFTKCLHMLRDYLYVYNHIGRSYEAHAFRLAFDVDILVYIYFWIYVYKHVYKQYI